MSAKYETTVTLPTNGKLYGDDGPTDVTIRAMTTKEEKLLLGSTSNNVFDDIVKACIVEPKNLDFGTLIASDAHFLLMKLRIHTYGSAYNIECTCPKCGRREQMTINLDDFPIYTLDDNFKEPIEIDLPVSGDHLSCRLLRNKDLDFINRQARKLSKTTKVPAEEIAYNLRMSRYITAINGEKVDDTKTQAYTQEMHGRDSATFWGAINKTLIGYDTTIELTCPNCNTDYEVSMPITSEFFRPTY